MSRGTEPCDGVEQKTCLSGASLFCVRHRVSTGVCLRSRPNGVGARGSPEGCRATPLWARPARTRTYHSAMKYQQIPCHQGGDHHHSGFAPQVVPVQSVQKAFLESLPRSGSDRQQAGSYGINLNHHPVGAVVPPRWVLIQLLGSRSNDRSHTPLHTCGSVPARDWAFPTPASFAGRLPQVQQLLLAWHRQHREGVAYIDQRRVAAAD